MDCHRRPSHHSRPADRLQRQRRPQHRTAPPLRGSIQRSAGRPSAVPLLTRGNADMTAHERDALPATAAGQHVTSGGQGADAYSKAIGSHAGPASTSTPDGVRPANTAREDDDMPMGARPTAPERPFRQSARLNERSRRTAAAASSSGSFTSRRTRRRRATDGTSNRQRPTEHRRHDEHHGPLEQCTVASSGGRPGPSMAGGPSSPRHRGWPSRARHIVAASAPGALPPAMVS